MSFIENILHQNRLSFIPEPRVQSIDLSFHRWFFEMPNTEIRQFAAIRNPRSEVRVGAVAPVYLTVRRCLSVARECDAGYLWAANPQYQTFRPCSRRCCDSTLSSAFARSSVRKLIPSRSAFSTST